MAFVAALPTVVGGLGTLAGALPVIGGPIASMLGTGAAGGGIAGALGSLGAGGGLSGALGSLGTGLKGMLPALGGAGTGLPGIGQGLGTMYGGLDKALAGFLPNMGVAGTTTPAQGFLGSFMPKSSMFGDQVGYGTVANPPEGGFVAPGNDGGGFGGLKEIMGKGMEMKGIFDGMKKETPPSPASQQHINNLRSQSPQSPPPQIISNLSGANRGGIFGSMGASPAINYGGPGGGIYQETQLPMSEPAYRQFGATPAGPYYAQSGADRVLERA